VSAPASGETEARRRLGLWETAMMVLGGRSGGNQAIALPMMLIIVGTGVIAFVLVSLGSRYRNSVDSPQLAFYGSLAMLYASMGMVAYTLHRTRAAAFLRTLPPLHAPRALLLLPMFVVGAALSVLALPFFPPLAAVAFLGWWCFAATMGHRFAGRGGPFLFFVALPLSYLGPVASAIAYSAWQWPGATLTSLLLAAVGYATSPRDRAHDITLKLLGAEGRSSKPSGTTIVVPRPRLTGAIGATLRAFTHNALSGSAVRLPRTFSLSLVASFALYALLAWAWPLLGLTNFAVFYGTTFVPAFWLSSSCEPARLEFMATRPLRAWQRRWASSHVWIWGILVLSILAFLRTMALTTVDHDDLRKSPYPTATIDAAIGAGATIAPAATSSAASSPRSARRHARPVPVSPTLRGLLLRFIGIVALLHWATFSALAALSVGRARKSRGLHPWLAGFATVVALLLAFFASLGPKESTLAPLWLAALLAAAGTFELRRSLRLPLRA
jgi:hypothetical protein